jgi:hypothetical protein
MRLCNKRPRVTLFILLFLVASLTAVGHALASGSHRCKGRDATIVGRPVSERIQGTDGSDVIVAGGGNDVVMGHGDTDFICGGAGKDTLSGSRGNDQLDGGRGSDSLDGGNGRDDLEGGRSGDVLRGRWGRDVFTGGHGADVLKGGEGFDSLDLTPVDRGIRLNLTRGTLRGDGPDRVSGIRHAVGTRFADVLIGSSKHNDLIGESGDDILRGRGGSIDSLQAFRMMTYAVEETMLSGVDVVTTFSLLPWDAIASAAEEVLTSLILDPETTSSLADPVMTPPLACGEMTGCVGVAMTTTFTAEEVMMT